LKIFKEIYHFLKLPFSKEESWFGLSKNFVSISIGTTLFLYIFQPSGLSTANPKFLICLGFGIAGALGYFLYELGFSQLVKRVPIKWTYGKWLTYSIGVLFFIALANFLYVRHLVFGYMDWRLFPAMLRGVFLLGIPILSVMLAFLYREEKKYQSIAEEMNAEKVSTFIAPSSDNLKIFGIPISHIRYIESLQNYVTIGYVDETQQFKKQTERATLKGILQAVDKNAIVRTHRSFLVNQQAIVETAGNSQGLLLTLAHVDKKIPVSRSYVSTFRHN